MRSIAVAAAASVALLDAHVAAMPKTGLRNDVVATEVGQSGSCFVNFGNSSFNVAPLQINSFYYVNDDRNNFGSGNYTYYFNICANTGLIPNIADCNYTGSGAFMPTTNTGPSPAFQYANIPVPVGDKCHRLGGDVTVNPIVYGLYDVSNPSRGVSLQYSGGDVCPGGAGLPRTLRVWLLCYNDAVNIPDQETVLESSSCFYDIFVNSAFGCPAECPAPQDPTTGARNLCSNHGVCDFDRALGTSRCFCNGGYEGKDCGTVSVAAPKGLSALGGVLIGVGVFLALTLMFLVFLWMRIRSLRLDPSAYSALRAGPDMGDGSVQ